MKYGNRFVFVLLLFVGICHGKDWWWSKAPFYVDRDTDYLQCENDDFYIAWSDDPYCVEEKSKVTVVKDGGDGDSLMIYLGNYEDWCVKPRIYNSYNGIDIFYERGPSSSLIGVEMDYNGNKLNEVSVGISRPRIVKGLNGDYLIVSSTYAPHEGKYIDEMFCVSEDFDILWKTEVDGSFQQVELQPYVDSSYFVCYKKYQDSVSTFKMDMYSSKGNLNWRDSITVDGNAFTMQILTHSDSSLYILSVSRMESGMDEVMLHKVSNHGKLIWSLSLDKSRAIRARQVLECKDGSVFFSHNSLVYKISPDGNILFRKEFRGIENCIERIDDNFLLFAKHRIINIDKLGNKVWENYNNESEVYKIVNKSDNSYVIVGDIEYSSLPPVQYCSPTSPLSFNVSIETADSLNYRYALLKAPTEMQITPRGVITWVPTTDSTYMEHVTFLRVDGEGNSDTLWFDVWANRENPVIPVIQSDKNELLSYQSPMTISSQPNALNITSQEEINTVQLFSLQGKLLKSVEGLTSSTAHSINISSLAPGIHVLRVIAGEHQFNQTVVLQ